MGKALGIAGAGAWMLALAFGFGSAAWPEYIKPHPHLVIALGVMGLVMLSAPLIQRFYPIFGKDGTLKLRTEVLDVYMRPASDGGLLDIGDLFLLVSVELTIPPSAVMSYSLNIIRQGTAIPTEWMQDIERYVRVAKISDATRIGDIRQRYTMDALPVHLKQGQKTDGWLHFKIPAIPESVLGKCVLRLTAKSNCGASTYDKAEGAWPIVRRDYKIGSV
jgi:hypothetical protein